MNKFNFLLLFLSLQSLLQRRFETMRRARQTGARQKRHTRVRSHDLSPDGMVLQHAGVAH